MTNAQNLELDLKPWAAYVAGHHPYFVRLEQESNWRRVTWHGEKLDILDWRSLEGALGQIDEALRILVLGGKVNAAALVELHRAKDAFARICAEQQMSPPEFDMDGSKPLGTTEWFHMLGQLSLAIAQVEDFTADTFYSLAHSIDLGTSD